MPIFRVHKQNNYTTIDNNIFKNKELSWKATGLIATMLSLPDDWDFSINGLAILKKDKETVIRTGLKELENLGYLKRTKIKNNKGRIIDWEYDIYECPVVEKPLVENPHVENQPQLNTNIIKDLNNKKENINNKLFIQKKVPTLTEIEEYCKSRNNDINPQTFYDYYSVNNWKDVKNWKQKIITWEGRNSNKPKKKTREQEYQEQLERMKKLDMEEEENEKRRNSETI